MIIFDIETCPADNAVEFCVQPKDGRSKSIADQLEAAALSPITGKVLAIGVMLDGEIKLGASTMKPEPMLFHGENEMNLLDDFWEFYRDHHDPGDTHEWVGFNINSFDLPFLWKRSIINGIKPPTLFTERGYPMSHFVDLRQIWQCGDRQAHGSLDVIARLMGFEGKTGDGAQFATLYRSEETRQQALDYITNDLNLTKKIAKRMGL